MCSPSVFGALSLLSAAFVMASRSPRSFHVCNGSSYAKWLCGGQKVIHTNALGCDLALLNCSVSDTVWNMEDILCFTLPLSAQCVLHVMSVWNSV